ncbi:MAG: sensor histidine kinase [Gemmataceae bacterium]
MRESQNDSPASVSNLQLLLGYVTDLELEVDRLRKQSRFIQHEARGTLKQIQQFCKEGASPASLPPVLDEIDRAATQLRAVLRDLEELPGYHPTHDQVIAIAIRPLVEQVFRWQHRLAGVPVIAFRLELEIDHVDWFPARLRHILDNLIADSLKHRDADKAEPWLCVGFRRASHGYELRVSDNGVGLPPGKREEVFALLYRSPSAQAVGGGIGPAIVKLLVEQSGGSLTVESAEGQGTTFVAVLPRYDVDDYLT